MPIYPQHKLTYIHIPKTAGGSIERLLEPYKAQGSKTALNRILRLLPIKRNIDRAYIPGHATALKHRAWMGSDLWETFTSFTVVRNPYDRLISEYEYVRQTPRHHRHKHTNTLAFEDYLAERSATQMSFITNKSGDIIVDHILRFEELHDGLDTLFAQLGIAERLPHKSDLNSSNKKARSAYLSPEAIEIINTKAAQDFKRLGYTILDVS
jgi:hypothetical protein